MPYVRVDEENNADIKLYYEDHGEGQPVVFIHGFPLSLEAWEKQEMAARGAGYRTILYDRRGFGRSDKPAFGYDYDTFATDLERLMTMLDLWEVILVGHSMGTGEIARYLSRYGSGRVAKAMFIAPLMPFLLKTSENHTGVPMTVFDRIHEAIAIDRQAYYTQFLHDFYNLEDTLGDRVSDEVMQANWNTASQMSSQGTYDCVTAWLTDFRKDLPRIDVETLILQGDQDRVLPIDATGRAMHAVMPDSRLVVIPGAPHGVLWTHADEVNRELVSFLRVGLAQEDMLKESVLRPRVEPAFGEQIDDGSAHD